MSRITHPLRVGIVGCGTAGGACALFLARAGHRVTVFEAVPSPKAVGAGIILQPTGQWVLRQLGLQNYAVEMGARLDRLHCVTRGGRTLVDLTYRHIGPDLFGIGLHRGVLFESLFNACKRERSVDVLCGHRIEHMPPRHRTGRYLADDNGQVFGPFDLVVVADGASSQLRDDMPQLHQRVREYPWGAAFFVAEDTGGHYTETRQLRQVVHGTGYMLGFLPTGRHHEGDKPLVSVYWSMRQSEVQSWRERGYSAWRDDVLSISAEAEPLLDQIDSLEPVVFARYLYVRMRPWHVGDVVFLGDAAHAMSPQLGQGANLALVDAWTLADCLCQTDNVSEALAAYTRRRRAHLRYNQWATDFLTPFFQGDYRSLGILRDTFMGVFNKIPIFQRIMAQSMAGTAQGPLRRPLRLGTNRLLATSPPSKRGDQTREKGQAK